MNTYRILIFTLIISFLSFNVCLFAMEQKEDPKIEIKTKDKKEFLIERAIAKKYSGFIQDMLEEQKEEEEILSIPLQVFSHDFEAIQALMKQANDWEKEGIDKLIVTYKLADIIKRWNWSRKKIRGLFKSLDYLNAEILLQSLAFYLIDRNPRVYLEYTNPLHLRKGENKTYQKYLKKAVNNFIMFKARGKGFNEWFDRAKMIPQFPEKIARVIWCFAVSAVHQFDETLFKRIFNALPEENLLKMAFRLAYYKKMGRLLDTIDLNKFLTIFGGESINIAIQNCVDYYRFINMFLYLTTAILPRDLPIGLSLEKNGLTDIPDALYVCDIYCKRIDYLILSFNKIIDLPENIKYLINLKELNLNNNQLALVPEVIQKLYKLTVLRIEQNPLLDLPNFFIRMPSLKKLYIDQRFEKSTTIQKLKKRGINVIIPDRFGGGASCAFHALENMRLFFRGVI